MKEKMSYVKPSVQKVEFDFKTRIAASGCNLLVPEQSWCSVNEEDL